jgi:hypothetical protein
MREDAAMRLLEVVETLERDIDFTASLRLDFTTGLLRMARLDLLTLIHGISDEELQAFGEALNAKTPSPENKIIHLAARRR